MSDGTIPVIEELVEHTDDGLFAIDASGQISFLNSSFADLLGYEPSALRNEPAEEIFPADHFEAIEEQVQTFVTVEREQLRREIAFEKQDGSELTAAVTLSVRETAGGAYRGMLGTARDVRTRKHRARELERYETIVQAVGDPVCTLDRNGRFCYVNDSFERTIGYGRETALDETLALLFEEADVDAVESAISAVHETGAESVTAVEVTVTTNDGGTIPMECRIATLPTGVDDPQAAVAVLHDISRLKQREQRLSKFASVVSHDLRNPMDVVLGRAEMLPEIADVDEETERHLEDIYESVKRMERIIQDVLTLTRQREEQFETIPVSLPAVADEAWDNVATESATLTVDASAPIEAHRSRLAQLLENLFRNAIQHGGDDVTVSVELLSGPAGAPVGFRVSDDGIGIPDEHRQQIFEDGFTTTTEGTGLGLAIVTEVADAHGWTIDVRDDGDGATFEITGVEPGEA